MTLDQSALLEVLESLKAADEWQTGDRRYLAEATMALLTAPPAATTTELAAA
ncbi:hypothetical protein ACNTMW_33180 [Planosporangium sp. 12N6]|uniref:hypothetical protein n=1 Tax=Planosporangium spinosum TaxID=3402278 RepID=UPI003CF6E9FA